MAGAGRLILGGVSKLDNRFFGKSNSSSSSKSSVKMNTGSREVVKTSVLSNKGKIYDNTPSKNHSTTIKNPKPIGEKPNSSVDILDKNGNIKIRRWYDANGNAIRDLDMTNHGNSKLHPEFPHEHKWEFIDGIIKRK